MEDYPQCSICFDIYGTNQTHIKVPKFLKCGDTFCKECLEKIIKKSDEDYFLCPMCKEKINKEKSLDDYPSNKEVIRLVNSYFNIPEKEAKNSEDEKIIKYDIVLLGDTSVGKTSIFQRLSKDTFTDDYSSTVGIDITPYYIKYKSRRYKLIFNDITGQEKYKSITKSILRQKDGVLFIYDISDKESFDGLQYWYDLYKEENKNVVGLLIGNKCDCERKVNEKEANKFSKEHGLKFIETSAKLDKNIKKAIACLLEKIIESERIEETEDNTGLENSYTSLSSYNDDTIKINHKNEMKKKICCC